MIRNRMSPKICHFGVKYSNSVLNYLRFIIIPLDSSIQIKVLINDLTLLLDLFGNSERTKLLIWTVIFCLVFTAPEKWRVELRAKTGHYRNRCFEIFFSPNICSPHESVCFDTSNVLSLLHAIEVTSQVEDALANQNEAAITRISRR